MRNWMIALGLVMAISAGYFVKTAHAWTCNTSCYGNNCTTTCN